MDNLIGQRFSLISKSEIRYVGTLHEINPEQSTIALEEVFSFGTENRPVAAFIPPSTQKFEYIVFRGSDVKDIKIEEEEPKENKQQQPHDDPAILNSSRPGPAPPSQGPPPGPPSTRGESPFPPQPNYPPQGFGGYYGPPPGQFGRGYGPPPGAFGPGPGYPPYGPPPPGYYGPPGQNFPPQGPSRFPPQQQHPPPIGPPGQRPPPPGQPQQQPPPQQSLAPAPGLPTPASTTSPSVKPTPELPVEKAAEKSTSKPATPVPQTIPTEASKPAPVPAPVAAVAQPPQAQVSKQPPTQPKAQRITPAMPFAVNQRSFIPPVSADALQSTSQQSTKPAKSQAEMVEESRKAKEAVENALASLNSQTAQTAPPAQVAQPTPSSIDNITERVSQITTGPPSHRGQRGNYRGQRATRTASGGQARPAPQKMEIPQSDFDFESANAKFNKEDLIKEAIASGSPITEDPPSATALDSAVNGTPARKDSYSANTVPAYNKSSSFFDNISSEAKDREESRDVNGRALRGAEFKKNVETFGQGNVDSGYRGRGRGGFRGQRRGYAGNRDTNGGYRGGYRGRGRGDGADITTA